MTATENKIGRELKKQHVTVHKLIMAGLRQLFPRYKLDKLVKRNGRMDAVIKPCDCQRTREALDE